MAGSRDPSPAAVERGGFGGSVEAKGCWASTVAAAAAAIAGGIRGTDAAIAGGIRETDAAIGGV